MAIEISGVAATEPQKTAIRAGIGAVGHLGIVANEAAMTSLSTAATGDTCTRADTGTVWVLSAAPYSTAGNWKDTGGALLAGTTISASRALVAADKGRTFLVDTTAGAVELTTATGIFTSQAAGGTQVILFRRSGANALTFVQGASTTLADPDAYAVPDGGQVALLNHPTLGDHFLKV